MSRSASRAKGNAVENLVGNRGAELRLSDEVAPISDFPFPAPYRTCAAKGECPLLALLSDDARWPEVVIGGWMRVAATPTFQSFDGLSRFSESSHQRLNQCIDPTTPTNKSAKHSRETGNRPVWKPMRLLRLFRRNSSAFSTPASRTAKSQFGLALEAHRDTQ